MLFNFEVAASIILTVHCEGAFSVKVKIKSNLN
jgi:hypothetical protein